MNDLILFAVILVVMIFVLSIAGREAELISPLFNSELLKGIVAPADDYIFKILEW